jgi:hypothetical protein
VNRLHLTRLVSIGAVAAGDNPPAEILLFKSLAKRQFSQERRAMLAAEGMALPDGSFPIETVGDLRNAIQSMGRAAAPASTKRHIIRRARALNAVQFLPDDWEVSKAEPREGRTMRYTMALDISHLPEQDREAVMKELDELAATISALEAKIAAVSGTDEPALPDDLPEPVQKRLAALDEAVAKANAEAASAKAETAKLVEERLAERFTTRAGQLRRILGPDMAPVLKELAAAAPAAYDKLDAQLDVVAKLVDLSAELGDSAASGSANDKITAIAKSILEQERDHYPNMTQARAEAWRRNPDLVAASREEG